MNINQEVNLSSSDYDLLIWVFRVRPYESYAYQASAICMKGQDILLSACVYATTFARAMDYSSATKYIAETGYEGTSTANHTKICVPIAVYGVKL